MDTIKDWTNKKVRITDIRKFPEFYIFTIDTPDVAGVLSVKKSIFEERLKSYFLKEAHDVTREEILDVQWNMYIIKGRYIKIRPDGVQTFEMDPDKYYVSYLEIEGHLGGIESVYRKDHKINLI
jgi:hypothetical protein